MVKIKLFPCRSPIPKMQFQPFVRYQKELLDNGYEFVDSGEDVSFVQPRIFKKNELFPSFLKDNNIKTPVVLFDAAAACTLGHIQLAGNSQVIGYVKKHILKDRNLYNFEYPKLRYHFNEVAKSLKGSGLESYKRPVPYTVQFHKLFLGWNLGTGDKFKGFLNDFPVLDKDLDIHCSVKMNLRKQHYSKHRQTCFYTTNEVAEKNGYSYSGKVKGQVYKTMLRRAKVGLSPWGLGEVCFRNFEIMIRGAICIAPDSSHVETWPDIYQPYKTYVPCNINFDNLEEVLADLLSNYRKRKQIAVTAFQYMRHCWQAEVFVSRFCTMMEGILKN